MKIEDIKIGKWYFCESFKLLNGSIIGIGENEFMVKIENPNLSNNLKGYPYTNIEFLTILVKENDIIKKYIADNEQKYQIGDSITFKKDIEITKRKVRAIGEDVVYFDNSDPRHFNNKVLGINHIRIHVENILKECQQENVEEENVEEKKEEVKLLNYEKDNTENILIFVTIAEAICIAILLFFLVRK